MLLDLVHNSMVAVNLCSSLCLMERGMLMVVVVRLTKFQVATCTKLKYFYHPFLMDG